MATVFRGAVVTRVVARQVQQPDHIPNLLVRQLFGQDKFFGAGPPDYDYPNPRIRPFPVECRTFEYFTLPGMLGKDQFFAGSGMGPDYDYPNPRIKPFPAECRSFESFILPGLLGKDAFFNGPGIGPDYDYPNPLVRPHPLDGRTHIARGVGYLGLDKFFTAGPPDFDWPNPALRAWRQVDVSQNLAVLAAPVVQAPFAPAQWPNPQRAAAWMREAGGNLQPLYDSPVAVPFAPSVGPNPLARPRTLEALVGNILPLTGTPFGAQYWPHPTVARRIEVGQGVNLFGNTLQPVPFVTSDWPNPRRAVRDQVAAAPNLVVGSVQAVPFTLPQWSNPPTRSWRSQEQGVNVAPLQSVPLQSPFVPPVWVNPTPTSRLAWQTYNYSFVLLPTSWGPFALRPEHFTAPGIEERLGDGSAEGGAPRPGSERADAATSRIGKNAPTVSPGRLGRKR